MAQKTSWEGSLTNQIRQSGKKGAYTRYANRRTKQGLQVVTPHKHYLEVRTTGGTLIRLEPKYHNYNSDEKSANQIYRTQIQKAYKKALSRRTK